MVAERRASEPEHSLLQQGAGSNTKKKRKKEKQQALLLTGINVGEPRMMGGGVDWFVHLGTCDSDTD